VSLDAASALPFHAMGLLWKRKAGSSPYVVPMIRTFGLSWLCIGRFGLWGAYPDASADTMS